MPGNRGGNGRKTGADGRRPQSCDYRPRGRGGVFVGDVAGLLASLYMRGVEFVQVPTTVLAQVDASVGGKTGVNLVAGKNLVGTFYHPRVVLIDPNVLKKLPDREFRAGLYEALKCG